MRIHTEIETDHLAIGLTRPSMFMGVSIRLFFVNIALCAMLCIDAHTFFGVPLFMMAHAISAKLSVSEPNFFIIWAKSFFKTPPILNYRFWGKTNSYEPW